MKSKDSISKKSVSYQKKDGCGHANDKGLKVWFLVTHLISLFDQEEIPQFVLRSSCHCLINHVLQIYSFYFSLFIVSKASSSINWRRRQIGIKRQCTRKPGSVWKQPTSLFLNFNEMWRYTYTPTDGSVFITSTADTGIKIAEKRHMALYTLYTAS